MSGRTSSPCVNCNSSKSDENVELDKFLLRDRDNTFAAYIYKENGQVEINQSISTNIQILAVSTRDLTSLNRMEHPNWEEAVLFSAIERVGQRIQAWEQAKEARQDYETVKHQRGQ